MRKEIGKIQDISFGFGGYQEAEIGISVILSGKAWGVQDFKGTWAIERSDRAKWTEEDRIKLLGEMVMWACKIMKEANVQHLSDLKHIPVEVTFDGNTLHEWRILTEVL